MYNHVVEFEEDGRRVNLIQTIKHNCIVQFTLYMLYRSDYNVQTHFVLVLQASHQCPRVSKKQHLKVT
jgi:hypothetical protein